MYAHLYFCGDSAGASTGSLPLFTMPRFVRKVMEQCSVWQGLINTVVWEISSRKALPWGKPVRKNMFSLKADGWWCGDWSSPVMCQLSETQGCAWNKFSTEGLFYWEVVMSEIPYSQQLGGILCAARPLAISLDLPSGCLDHSLFGHRKGNGHFPEDIISNKCKRKWKEKGTHRGSLCFQQENYFLCFREWGKVIRVHWLNTFKRTWGKNWGI